MRKLTIVLGALSISLAVISFVWFPPIHHWGWVEHRPEAGPIAALCLLAIMTMAILERRTIGTFMRELLIPLPDDCPGCGDEEGARFESIEPDPELEEPTPTQRCRNCGYTQHRDPVTWKWAKVPHH